MYSVWHCIRAPFHCALRSQGLAHHTFQLPASTHIIGHDLLTIIKHVLPATKKKTDFENLDLIGSGPQEELNRKFLETVAMYG